MLLGCGGVAASPNDSGADVLDASVESDAHVTDDANDSHSPFPDAGTPEAGCNATTCPVGCCDGNACVTNITPDQCGASGQACVKCPAGDQCKGGCFHAQINCGPSNCPGCCLGDNLCATGTADVACGHGGAGCLRCVPSNGMQCLPVQGGAGGTCSAPDCNSTTCPGGCCLNGQCMDGAAQTSCGPVGGTCQVCNANQYCYQGQCLDGTPCTPQNCAGCCTTEADGGVCLLGTDDNECGSGGYDCQDCQIFHQACVSGVCSAPCSPATCHGCCDGNICAEGDQNFLCGVGGVACTNCEVQGQTCNAGACQ